MMKTDPPQKFLLIQFRQIGDVILTTPIPRLLRKHFPQARIDLLTFAVNEGTWRYNPHISNLITFDKKKGFFAFVKLLMQIRKSGYDAVLDFQDTPRSTYCILASGAQYRVIWETSSRRRAYNTLVSRTEGYPAVTKSDLLRPFIADIDRELTPVPKPEVHVSEKEVRRIDDIFQTYGIGKDDFIVTMAPTHKRVVRRWDIKFFMQAAHFLIEHYNAKVILSWGPGESDYIQSGIAQGDYAHPHLISDLFLNLLELAALMQRAKFHIGNDSAPLHLAVARNLPTFTIFGATSFSWSYPSPRHACTMKNMDCQPCNKKRCLFGDAIPCVKEFEFDQVRPQLQTFIETVVLK